MRFFRRWANEATRRGGLADLGLRTRLDRCLRGLGGGSSEPTSSYERDLQEATSGHSHQQL